MKTLREDTMENNVNQGVQEAQGTQGEQTNQAPVVGIQVVSDAQLDAVKRVKKLIIEKSLTVSELSKRTGYSISYISMIINGRRKNGEVRDAIARALERSPQELWAGC